MAPRTRHRQAPSRLTAAVTLAALAVLLMPPPNPAGAHACPPPAPASVALLPAPQHCHHVQAGACADMFGCLATPVAVVTAPVLVELAVAVVAATTGAPVRAYGRLAIGPPTPPPNS